MEILFLIIALVILTNIRLSFMKREIAKINIRTSDITDLYLKIYGLQEHIIELAEIIDGKPRNS